jgi:hypothetical protein
MPPAFVCFNRAELSPRGERNSRPGRPAERGSRAGRAPGSPNPGPAAMERGGAPPLLVFPASL